MIVFILLLFPLQSYGIEKPDSISNRYTWGMSSVNGLPTLITLGIRIHYTWNDEYTFFYVFTPRLPFTKDDDLSSYHKTFGIGYILKKWENVKIIPNIAYINYNYVMHEDLPNQEEWYFKSNHLSLSLRFEFSFNHFVFEKKQSLFGEIMQRYFLYFQAGYITNIADHPQKEFYDTAKETNFFPEMFYFGPWSYSAGFTIEYPIGKK